MNPVRNVTATLDGTAGAEAGTFGTSHPARPDRATSRSRLFKAAIVISSMVLAGCQNIVAESGNYYNAGLADSFNSLLLTNIIRSAKGQPTYYSAIGDYSGSLSTDSSQSIDADLPFTPISDGSLSVSVGPSRSRDRNANVSSLETKDFAQSMHTPITSGLLVFLVEGRDGAQLNLVMSLAIKRIVLVADELNQLVNGAIVKCNTSFATLPGAARGICRDFSTVLANAACAGDIVNGGKTLVQLTNDPTNACEYARFRLFAEAMAILQPHLALGKDGNPVFTLGIATGQQKLFGAKGTGFVLRSPNEVIQYLGEIVRVRYAKGANSVPRLSTRDGASVPIFLVKEGGNARKPDTVRVDGTTYRLPEQRLGADEKDFSYRSLAIVKDLLTLNTSQDQLPKNPTIVVGGSGN